jgi:S1-C subfamily serine protease
MPRMLLAMLLQIATLSAPQNSGRQGAVPTAGSGLNMTAAVNKIRPSVVQIMFTLDYKFVNPAIRHTTETHPAGSGFLADTTHVITARHVIEDIEGVPAKLTGLPLGPNGPIDAQSIRTQLLVGFAIQQLADKQQNWVIGSFVDVPAKVFKRGDRADVAILELEPNTLAHLGSTKPISMNGTAIGPIKPMVPKFANDLADEGEMIAASGFPLNIPSLVTNVGWLGSKFALEGEQRLQIGSVLINPGNSGGPVYRVRDGVIIGIAKGYWNAPGDVQVLFGNIRAQGQAALNSGLSEIVPIQEALNLLSH